MFNRFAVVLLAAFVFALGGDVRPAHAGGNWIKKVVPYTQFEAVATTDTVVLYTTRAFESIDAVVMRRDVDFAGGSITSYTVSVGKSGATSKYQSATDVFTGVSNGNTNSIVTAGRGVEASGVSIIATAVASHNLSTATAGGLTFFIFVSTIPPGTA